MIEIKTKRGKIELTPEQEVVLSVPNYRHVLMALALGSSKGMRMNNATVRAAISAPVSTTFTALKKLIARGLVKKESQTYSLTEKGAEYAKLAHQLEEIDADQVWKATTHE